jgi:serine/alanine racemase
MNKKQQYGGLDYFKLIAAFLVVAIHTSPLESISVEGDFFLTRILARLAVPLFFMATGHFVLSDYLKNIEAGSKSVFLSIKKLFFLYGIAIIIYIPIGIYSGQYRNKSFGALIQMLLVDGTFYHLWYLPASIVGILILYYLRRILSLHKIAVLSVVLYFIGLFGDSYYGLISNMPGILKLYKMGFHLFSYTRNGLFMAPIFLIMGAYLGDKCIHRKRRYYLFGFLISFVLMSVEGIVLHSYNIQRHDSMYILLPVCMYFLYCIALLWRVPSNKVIRTISTWIYMIHPMMIIAIRGVSGFLRCSYLFVDNSIIHYLLVGISSFTVSYLLIMALTKKKPAFRKGRAWIELDIEALKQNVMQLRSRLPAECKLMAAVKAQAYGHGELIIAKQLNKLGIYAFCVASVLEGIQLRKNGVKGEILILGYTDPKQFQLLRRYHLIQTVLDFDYAIKLNSYGKKFYVHIGIDTGMHRVGERCENKDKIYQIYQMKNLVVDGIFTHLCVADSILSTDIDYSKKQIQSFHYVIAYLNQRGIYPKIHYQSSYGVINYPELSSDYARVGIAIYGVLSTKQDTQECDLQLKPVLSLKTRVVSVKKLYSGEGTSYGLQFIADHDMQIATISIGYADGLPRSLSNGVGKVLIHGYEASILGRICMDQTIIDVSNIPNIKSGDIAIIIGHSGDREISVCDIAMEADTISNEILSRLGTRLERIMV